jgi:hypothetical protein
VSHPKRFERNGSKMYAHGIVNTKRFAAVGAFPRAVRKPVLNALLAEKMAACLDHRVLDLALADSALE